MKNLFDVSGKNVLITGAGRGLGLGYAHTFAAAGSRVFLAGRHQPQIEKIAGELRAAGGKAEAVLLDVTSSDSIDAAVSFVMGYGGTIDVLVNNAGYEQVADFTEVTRDTYDKIMAVNLKGTFFMSQAVAKCMKQTGGGKIINIGSLGSFLGLRQSSVYCATKGGVVQLTKTMALELGAYGIQVNCLAPGYFITPMTQAFYDDPQHRAWIESRIPLARWGTNEDLAGAVLFLASAASDYITGETIRVDGGWLAG
ncbi:SDR family NAD(P)-dependent oxidoreductase [uncultured Mitsuokella sp.]|uniref:SDR family NAD(P)-dependent oxidoreductase n=1 Tax=uncultured Mitsuokella sp. TaxID=453120 RepID=UPI002620EEAD|nr:glucose 1-dehydrogenase [uncultured Mitsuokella sp.]